MGFRKGTNFKHKYEFWKFIRPFGIWIISTVKVSIILWYRRYFMEVFMEEERT